MIAEQTAPGLRAKPLPRAGYIAGRWYDGVFFIFAPLLALALGFVLSFDGWWNEGFERWDYEESSLSLFLGSFIFAHLALVFFRSHANQAVFRTYPYRFTVVPLALLAVMSASEWVAVSVSVLATWWDVYHSSLQTFGLARIYDARAGNETAEGRRLDYLLNLLLYMGPILAGAALMDHVSDFDEFESVGSVFFTAIPAYVEGRRAWLTWGVLAGGVPFVAFYLFAYWRFARNGRRVSFQKVALLSSTALTSIWAWGFNSFGMAFFIMNFFHALQYFALVWWTERKNLVRLFRLESFSWGSPAALLLMVGSCFAYGVWAEALISDGTMFNLVMVVSIMHFWYDGFIWSVRKKQV